MFGVVGERAAAKEELIALEVWEEAAQPARREVLARQSERVAHGEAEQTPDDGFAREGHTAIIPADR